MQAYLCWHTYAKHQKKLLHWIDLLNKNESKITHTGYNKLDHLHHLKSDTNIVDWGCTHDFKTITILLKWQRMSNWLWSTWVQSCFHIFNRSIQYSCFKIQLFFLLVSSTFFVCLFVCFVVSKWRTAKCELIGGRSPRHFNTV